MMSDDNNCMYILTDNNDSCVVNDNVQIVIMDSINGHVLIYTCKLYQNNRIVGYF